MFSPSLKTSTNSLFAKDGEYRQEFEAFSRGKRGESKGASSSSSRVAADRNDDSSGAVIEHSSRNDVRGGGGGGGANAEAIGGTGSGSSKSGLGSVHGRLDPPSPPLATADVTPSSSQEDKDFVEEVRRCILVRGGACARDGW